jgi:uncharacterized protein Yka (UPF0111/DUF47 family)
MNENIHQELIKLQNELNRLKNAVEHIDEAKEASKNVVKATESFLLTSNKIYEDYENLAEKTKQLIKEIDSIDFPKRLDKIDFNITGINTGLQNVFSRFDGVERNLSDKILSVNKSLEELKDSLIKVIDNKTKDLLEKLTEIKEYQDNTVKYFKKVNRWIFISLSTIILIVTIILLFFIIK